jgi:hypothetical protein
MKTFRFFNEVIIEAENQDAARDIFDGSLTQEFIQEVEIEEIPEEDIEEREELDEPTGIGEPSEI